MLLDLVHVPGGYFLMGCEQGRDEERPVHRVWVDEFLLGTCPVRNLDYRAFLDATSGPPPPFWDHPDFRHPEQPVAAVSWFEARGQDAMGRFTPGGTSHRMRKRNTFAAGAGR
jgi:formylglycine-generating enzyme required for sulfatase activity